MPSSKRPTTRRMAVYAFGALALWRARPEASWLAWGGLLALSGLLLRLWATGYLVKNRSLTQAGPYRHLRHPLYLGTWLIATGFLLASRLWWLLLAFQLGFFLYYLPRKEGKEAARLQERFGLSFASFKREVPSFLPRLRPAPPGTEAAWSWGRIGENSEWGTVWGVLAAFAFLTFRMEGILP